MTGHPPLAPLAQLAASSASPTGSIYPGWRIVALAFLLQLFATGPIYYAFGNYTLLFQAEFGATRTQTNLAYSILIAVGAIGAAPVGWMLDRWRVRWVIAAGIVGTAAGLALLAAAQSIGFVILCFATAIAFGDVMMGMVPANFIVARCFERRRGLALGVAVLGASVAAVVFPPLTTVLVQGLGWRGMFLTYAVATLILIVPTLLLAGTPPSIPQFERRGNAHVAGDGPRLSLVQMIATPAFWIISFAVGAMVGVTGAVTISIVPDAVGRGFGELQAASLVSIIGAGAFVGKVGFGAIADRVELRHALSCALVAMAVACALLLIDLSYPALCGAAILFGLSLGGMMPVWAAMVTHVFGVANCGSALGLTRAAMLPCTILCPMIAGLSSDRFGSYHAAWIAFVALLAASLLATLVSRDWARPVASPRLS